MSKVFADTFYWIAITDPRDAWHIPSVAASRSLGSGQLVTTEPVLIELLNHFCGYGAYWRDEALRQVETILASQFVDVVPYTATTLRRAMEFYADRRDKAYSLTDCISMLEMRELQIYEVLTRDLHFEQEGFVLLVAERSV